MADISKIRLPSGNEYEIKDATARQLISGGVSFNIVWTAADYASSSAPNAAKLATIPAGVTVYYNNGAGSATGTLAASNETIGKFYLIYSKTQAGTLDAFDEYVTIGDDTKTWEKIGDTLIDLSGVVTNVELNKQTDTVIGTDATFTVTQPTVSLDLHAQAMGDIDSQAVITSVGASTTYLSASATGGGASWNSKDTKTVVTSVSAENTNVKATASGANVAWNSKDAKTVLTGVKADTTNIKATASSGSVAWDSKDAKTVLTGVQANTTNVKATASGANVAWNSKDSKTVVTSVSASTDKLATTTLYGVQSTTTTASKATAATTQVTATGQGTTTTDNTDWLKGVSVSSEVLIIGAAALNTQSTTQQTFSDVTVPIKNSATTTVATGQLGGTGATVATGASAGSTAAVIGSSATFTVTQPTVALASGATAGTGVISLAYGAAANGTASVIGGGATFSYTDPTVALSSGASAGTGVITVAYGASANGTASVIGNSATFSVTQPTVALSSGATAGTGVLSLATGVSIGSSVDVIGSDATLSNTQPTIALSSGSSSGTGKVKVAYGVTATESYMGATASGGNVAWNSKDSVTVLTSSTSITVTKGT